MKPSAKLKVFCAGLVGLSLVFFFQNCSEGFKTSSSGVFAVNAPFGVEDMKNPGDATVLNINIKEHSEVGVIAAEAVVGAPREGGLLQRQGHGKAVLNLQITVPIQTAFYRTKLISDSTVQTSGLTPVQGNSFALQISTGFRQAKLMIQFFNHQGLEIAHWTSSSFSVGDIFLVAGQSNAATHAQVETRSNQILNKALDPSARTWVPLQDPLPAASHWKMRQFGGQGFYGGSPWPSFADLVSARWGVPVGIVSVAWGGSSVMEWLQGGSSTYTEFSKTDVPLVTRLIQAAQALPGCQFKAILWHQGESDAVNGTTPSQYKDRMVQLRQKFIQQTGCQQPWVVARASFVPKEFNISFAHMTQIRDAQNELWSVPGFLPGPDTDLVISGAYRFDSLHFSSSGLNIHAQLWLDKVQALVGGTVGFTEEQRVPEVKQIVDLYREILKRQDRDIFSDYNGVFYHSRVLQGKENSLNQVRETFLASDEAFIQTKYQQYHHKTALMSEVLSLLGKLQRSELKNRVELDVYIQNLFRKTSGAALLGQPLVCGSLGNADIDAISVWYKTELRRCPEQEGVSWWYAEWKKQKLSLSQWKSQAWDSNPQIQVFKKCFGDNPTDAVVTACYRSLSFGGNSFELCPQGAPWLYRVGSESCYLN